MSNIDSEAVYPRPGRVRSVRPSIDWVALGAAVIALGAFVMIEYAAGPWGFLADRLERMNDEPAAVLVAGGNVFVDPASGTRSE